MINKIVTISFWIVLTVALAACSNYKYAQSIPMQTRMSEGLRLNAVPDSAKTVYISIENHSSLSSSYIQNNLMAYLSDAGFELVKNPDYAHYVLKIEVERVLRIASQDLALDIGRSPYKTPLDTVPTYAGDRSYYYYVGVADIKLIVKNAYASGGRDIYKTRLVAFPDEANLGACYAKPAIAYAMVRRITHIFKLYDE